MASLIEKETDGTDRTLISSVIHNRLENVGETAHLLQIDASLVYAAGREITEDDYQTLDSPITCIPTRACRPRPSPTPVRLHPGRPAAGRYQLLFLCAQSRYPAACVQPHPVRAQRQSAEVRMTAERKKSELLAPAGDWEKLQMAVLYGADAVYLAGTSFGMRSFAGNFSDEELPRAVDFATGTG